MPEISQEFIKQYEELLTKDPKSRAFAPLSEAYLQMDLFEEALDTCLEGVQKNPHFAGGRVTLAKIWLHFEKLEPALEELNQALSLSHENLLAHKLLAETYIKLKKPKEALTAYKNLLLLNPKDAKTAALIQKLESLTAPEFEKEAFDWSILSEADETKRPSSFKPNLTRTLSLFDALLARQSWESARDILSKAFLKFGSIPELNRRQNFLNSRTAPLTATKPIPKQGLEKLESDNVVEKKLQLLRQCLANIEEKALN